MSPIRSILLALDASPRCRARLRFARELARRFDAGITAMPVLEPRFRPLPLPSRDGIPAKPLLSELDPQALRSVRAHFESEGGGMTWQEPDPASGSAGFVRRALCADWLVLASTTRRIR